MTRRRGGGRAMALALAVAGAALGAPPDPAALSQMLDQLSAEELAALLARVRAQKAAPAAAAPAARPPGPSAADRLAALRLEVAIRDTTGAILRTLGPAGEQPRVAARVGDLVTHAYRRTGPFSHSPRRGVTLSSGEAKLLAGKIRIEVEEAMGSEAPFELSPRAREVFEQQILAATPRDPAALQAAARARTASRLRSAPPARPLTDREVERLDAALHASLVRERGIDNHSSHVLKQWAQEEARRQRRRLIQERGPAGARAWMRSQR